MRPVPRDEHVRDHRTRRSDAQSATAGRAELDLDVRDDFPILTREFDGRPLIYLDSGATSQKPEAVIDAISAY